MKRITCKNCNANNTATLAKPTTECWGCGEQLDNRTAREVREATS